MAQPGLANQQHLLTWANSVAARSEFPRLVRRLILETGSGLVQLGFPAGEGTSVGDWDGSVRATEATPFIPAGLSLWELSVEQNATKKADRDYSKRTSTPDGSPTNESVYVAAILRRFANRANWARTRAEEGRWKDVRAYGVDDIETWLEAAPVTHVWFSDLLQLHPTGLIAAESWWSSWSTATEPAIPASLVLAGRLESAEALKTKLQAGSGVITVKGASLPEVLAFIWASVQPEVVGDGGSLSARAAWVNEIGTWRVLSQRAEPLLLVPYPVIPRDEITRLSPHHVIVPVLGPGDADIELPPMDSAAVTAMLKGLGVEDRAAEEAGRMARMSLMALRRRLAVNPELQQPSWAAPPVTRNVRRALLASRWNENFEADRAVISGMFGIPYEDVAEEVNARLADPDPLLTRTSATISVVSALDAWLLLRRELNPDDLTRLEAAALTVLMEVDPRFELAVDQQWQARLVGAERRHSDDLRMGIATTLALLGAHGTTRIVGSDATGANWASRIVRNVLRRAIEDNTGHLWATLSDVLPLLAEAAPDQFLDAVRAGLSDTEPLLRTMFMDPAAGTFFGPTSPHVHLLWALETCAWSPDHFGQAVDHLARLTELDPDPRSNNSNRPLKSLTTIFFPWQPGTSVNAERRLNVLDGMRTRHPRVAWQVMHALLPREQLIFPSQAPTYRDWQPQTNQVQVPEYVSFIEALTDRLVADAGTDQQRWAELVAGMATLPPNARTTVTDRLQDLAGQFGSEENQQHVWEALRKLVARPDTDQCIRE